MSKKIVILSGAGISAESGIATFRDADGLWEGHDVMTVASPAGWAADKDLVLNFYNQRRRQLLTVTPNIGHEALVLLEDFYKVVVITQNVDDLHERAGSKEVIHLHGELLKARSIEDSSIIVPWKTDIVSGSLGPDGCQLRPHIVWFGEAVPMIETAVEEISTADIVIIVGTSMQVYPAAGLVGHANQAKEFYYVDPHPSINYELQQRSNLRVIEATATSGLPTLVEELISKASA